MTFIAYHSPWVPAEWIAAHGLRPRWIEPGGHLAQAARGVCPYAGGLVEAVKAGVDASAMVITTTCDQMRYAAAAMEQGGSVPIFVMNVPSTWQTPVARSLYREELQRLGRFLVEQGGKRPEGGKLVRVMLEYEEARTAVLRSRERLSARQFAQATRRVREARSSPLPSPPTPLPQAGEGRSEKEAFSQGKKGSREWVGASYPSPPTPLPQGERGARKRNVAPSAGIRLALLGGPLAERDFVFLDLLEDLGARVVLDASEGGERTLPGAFDRHRIEDDPVGTLADAYFDPIPDVFRRPNDSLYDWLGRELSARRVRGIVFRRYVGCDLWHAERARLRQWSPVPVLNVDVDCDDQSAVNRTRGRLEAFVEMLA